MIDRGYPHNLKENLLSQIKLKERKSALLKQNTEEEKDTIQVRALSVSSMKEALMKKWNLMQNQPLLCQIFKEPPIISYKKGTSWQRTCLRAKISNVKKRFHPGK